MIQPPYLSLLPISMSPLPWLSLLLLLLLPSLSCGPPPLLLPLPLLLLLLLLLRPMLSLPCRCCCNRCRYHSNAQLLRNRSQTYLDHHTLNAAGNDEERGTLAPTRNQRPSPSFGSSKYQAGPSTARTSAMDSDCFTSCTTGLVALPAAKRKQAKG